jgi:hypothetical protein
MRRDMDTHPLAFAAGEAIASGATVALLLWETPAGWQWRTYPDGSATVVRGMADVLAEIVEDMRQAASDDDAD